MARMQQEIFEETREDEGYYINSFVPNIHHITINQDGIDTPCLEVEFINGYGDIETAILRMDIISSFCSELKEYEKGLLEAINDGGFEDA